MEIIRHLQEQIDSAIFTPRAAYDGKKNLFSTHVLKFDNDQDTQTVCDCFGLVCVELMKTSLTYFSSAGSTAAPPRPPRIIKVKLMKVAEINPT